MKKTLLIVVPVIALALIIASGAYIYVSHQDQVTQERIANAKLAAEKAAEERAEDRRQAEEDRRRAEEEARTSGFHDANYLARDIKSSMNSKADRKGYDIRAKKVGCVSQDEANTDFVCLVEWTGSDAPFDSDTLKVTVADDGNTWVSRSESESAS